VIPDLERRREFLVVEDVAARLAVAAAIDVVPEEHLGRAHTWAVQGDSGQFLI
jgi:hypothetical protein